MILLILKYYRAMMTPYSIITVPDPRLGQKSQPVEKVDDEVRHCMDRILATVHANRGLAIAAVQVGIMRRMIVIDIDGAYSERELPQKLHGGVPLYMVNPEIIDKSVQTAAIEEGCLSVPSVYVKVPRPESIKVKYLDYFGEEQIIDINGGLLSACVQHEMDHLDGVIISDYFSPLKKQMHIKKVMKHLKFDTN